MGNRHARLGHCRRGQGGIAYHVAGRVDMLQDAAPILALDLVVVEVRYIQANKKVFKTENLYFRDIGAGSALMQVAPKSSRGIKIDYKITLINSKELGLSYSGI